MKARKLYSGSGSKKKWLKSEAKKSVSSFKLVGEGCGEGATSPPPPQSAIKEREALLKCDYLDVAQRSAATNPRGSRVERACLYQPRGPRAVGRRYPKEGHSLLLFGEDGKFPCASRVSFMPTPHGTRLSAGLVLASEGLPFRKINQARAQARAARGNDLETPQHTGTFRSLQRGGGNDLPSGIDAPPAATLGAATDTDSQFQITRWFMNSFQLR